ncbi:uncharacterized protein LOC127949059 [Carassius gibelio]|uniref:uncharacterized protein LOC127949059 n=1 Tax=Carassius gibelio TaxID=101364 RepID=UPI0022784411|nr:uncharacterized protein LOC127949059 [Carassius gibelio]
MTTDISTFTPTLAERSSTIVAETSTTTETSMNTTPATETPTISAAETSTSTDISTIPIIPAETSTINVEETSTTTETSTITTPAETSTTSVAEISSTIETSSLTTTEAETSITTASETSTTTKTSTFTTTAEISTTSVAESSTTEEPVNEVKIKLEFRSKDSFIDDLNDRQSPAFINRARLVEDILTLNLKKFHSFLRVTVLLFSKGSVITTSELAFNSIQTVPSELQIAEELLSDETTLNALSITSISVNNTEIV